MLRGKGRRAGLAAIGGLLVLGMLPATYAQATPSAGSPEPVGAAEDAEEPTVDQLIVRYAPTVKAWTSVDDVAGEEAVDVDLQAGRWIGFGYRTVELPEAVSEVEAERIAADLTDSPEVLAAEPDLPVSTAVEPETLTISPQAVQSNPPWGLDRIDQRWLPLNQAYDYANTGAGVRAYIVDTGVLSTHSEFSGRMATGHTTINDGVGTEDCDGHGTHVAGTVAGTTYGVAKGATVVPVRVLNCLGSGTMSSVVGGLDWIGLTHPAGVPGVVNMSLGGGASSFLDSAVRSLVNKGLTVVVASGNDGTDACSTSPAREPLAITVNASTIDDQFAWFSNYGPCTDIYAPGRSVRSAWYTGSTASATLSGTSMASPHVAGVAARLLQVNPGFTPAQVWSAIQADATPVDFHPYYPTDAKGLVFLGTSGAVAPGAPSIVTAVAGDEQAAVSWNVPTYDGGAAITSYTATASDGVSSCTVTGSPLSTSCTITGLTNWQTYTFTVTATNSADTSSPSQATSEVLPGVIPTVPTGVTAAAGSGSADVTWTPGASVGAPTTWYVARASPGTRACSSTGTSCTISGLTGGTEYTITVIARNDFGASSASDPSSGVTPSAAVVTLPDPGTVVRWGTPSDVADAFTSDVVTISAGREHLLGINGIGSVIAMGENSFGQATVPSGAQANATAVAAGGDHSLALVGQGVVAWGRNSEGQSTVPDALLSGVSDIAAGERHSLALKDGQLFAWGDNAYGQLNLPDDSVGYTAISAGTWHSLAVKDGNVVTWGYGQYNLRPVPSVVQDETIVEVAAGMVNSLALTEAGRVLAWGDTATGVTNIPSELSSGVDAIAMGDLHALALKDGRVYAWGMTDYSRTAVPASAQTDMEVITAGKFFSAALRSTPIAPTGLAATAADNSSISVSWNPITRTGSVIDYYEVSYTVTGAASASSVETTSVDDSTAGTSYIITNVAPGATVTISVAGRNLSGTGESATTSARIPVSPSAVQGLTGTAGNGSVTLLWAPPVDDGGSAIIGYDYRVNQGLWTSTVATSVTITGLTNGSAATLDVRAANAAGPGTVSSITRTPQAPPPPAAPPVAPPPAPAPPPPPPPAEPLPPAPAPVPEPVTPGRGQAFVGDQPVDLVINPIGSGRGLDITGPDFNLVMESFGPDGEPLPLDDDGALQLEPALSFLTQGSGYLPGAQAAQYLVANTEAQTRDRVERGRVAIAETVEPIELGTVDIDETGFFAGLVVMPNDVPSGDYTVQIVGTASDGGLRVINIGVRVTNSQSIEDPTILLVGSREGRFIRVEGLTTGLEGQRVAPWLRLPGQTTYAKGIARRVVDETGAFSWQRRTNKKVAVYFATDDRSATSSRVVISPRTKPRR